MFIAELIEWFQISIFSRKFLYLNKSIHMKSEKKSGADLTNVQLLTHIHVLTRVPETLNCLISADFGPSEVRALPLAAGRSEGGHYFMYFSALLLLLLGTVVQNPRMDCHRVSNFCMGSKIKIITILGKK